MTWPERPEHSAETPAILRELVRGITFVQRDPLAPTPDARDIGRLKPRAR